MTTTGSPRSSARTASQDAAAGIYDGRLVSGVFYPKLKNEAFAKHVRMLSDTVQAVLSIQEHFLRFPDSVLSFSYRQPDGQTRSVQINAKIFKQYYIPSYQARIKETGKLFQSKSTRGKYRVVAGQFEKLSDTDDYILAQSLNSFSRPLVMSRAVGGFIDALVSGGARIGNVNFGQNVAARIKRISNDEGGFWIDNKTLTKLAPQLIKFARLANEDNSAYLHNTDFLETFFGSGANQNGGQDVLTYLESIAERKAREKLVQKYPNEGALREWGLSYDIIMERARELRNVYARTDISSAQKDATRKAAIAQLQNRPKQDTVNPINPDGTPHMITMNGRMARSLIPDLFTRQHFLQINFRIILMLSRDLSGSSRVPQRVTDAQRQALISIHRDVAGLREAIATDRDYVAYLEQRKAARTAAAKQKRLDDKAAGKVSPRRAARRTGNSPRGQQGFGGQQAFGGQGGFGGR